MVKQHLKSIATPRTWNINRKENIFTTRPFPGAHPLNRGMSLNSIMKEVNVSKTRKESKQIILQKDCFVNGKEAKDIRMMVGFMDVVSFPKLKKNYRILIDMKGKLCIIEIDDKESKMLLTKISGKTMLKGNLLQLNTFNARNILLKKDDYKTSDSLLIEIPSQKILKHFPFEKGSTIMLIGGRHIGCIGKVEDISQDSVFFKEKDTEEVCETLKKYVFVLGKNKPEIKVRAE